MRVCVRDILLLASAACLASCVITIPEGAACQTDAHCPASQVCSEGRCRYTGGGGEGERDAGGGSAVGGNGGSTEAGGGSGEGGGGGGSTEVGGGSGGSGGGGAGGGHSGFDGGLCGAGEAATLVSPDGSVAFCFNGFAWENPLPHGATLYGVWGSSADDVWAGGAASMLMHWDGRRWTSYQDQVHPVAGQERGDIRVIKGDGTRVLLAGDSIAPHELTDAGWSPQGGTKVRTLVDLAFGPGGPLVMEDYGTVWANPPAWNTEVSPAHPGRANSLFVHGDECSLVMTNTTRGEVWGCDGGLLWSVDGGESWFHGIQWQQGSERRLAMARAIWRLEADGGVSPLGGNDRNVEYLSVSLVGSDGGFLAGTQCGIADLSGALLDIGCQLAGTTLYGVSAFADGGGWAVGDQGLLVYQRGPSSWSLDQRVSRESLNALWIGDAGVVFAGSEGFHFLETGATWAVGGSSDVVHMGGARWWFTSRSGSIYETNGGADPTFVFSGSTPLNGILLSGGEAWAFGDDIMLSRQGDGGWAPTGPAGTGVSWIRGVRVGGMVVVVGYGAKVAIGDADGGWRVPSIPGSYLFGGVGPANANTVWLVGNGPSITRFDPATETLSPQDLHLKRGRGTLHDVWGFGEDDVWAVGDDGRAFHYDGSTWTSLTTGTDSAFTRVRGRVLPDGSKEVFLVGGAGVVLRYRYQ